MLISGAHPLSSNIETLVSAYVRLKNRRALEDMRELRRQLIGDLQSTSGHALQHVHDDLRAIEEGLKQLQS